MKNFIKVFLCVGLLLTMGGCSKDTKKDDEGKKKDTAAHVVNNWIAEGRVEEVNDTKFSLLADNGMNYVFDYTQMKLIGGDLLVGEIIRVKYVVKNDINIAKTGEVIEVNHVEKAGIDNIIANMTIEEKVGQMFFVRTPKEQAIEDINTYHLGGYILFDKDFKGFSFQEVVDRLAAYQAQSKIPMLIGVDEEGGTVVRLSRYSAFRGAPFWSPQALYNEGGFDLIRSDAKEKATLLKSIGINVNLAPVADVSVDPNDFINKRAFGKDADQTATYVSTVVSEMKNNGIGVTMKHFPGYGNNRDTHTGISIDERSFASFENNDFKPFIAGINAGAGSILVSHNIIESVDPDHPASLSPNMHDILRHELGFQGVIMTDDLAMGAILQYSDDNSAAVTAVKAGNDLLVCTNYRNQIPAVIQAVKDGVIQEARLDESLKRILKWKANLGLINVQ